MLVRKKKIVGPSIGCYLGVTQTFFQPHSSFRNYILRLLRGLEIISLDFYEDKVAFSSSFL